MEWMLGIIIVLLIIHIWIDGLGSNGKFMGYAYDNVIEKLNEIHDTLKNIEKKSQ
jgi:hypothetical protein